MILHMIYTQIPSILQQYTTYGRTSTSQGRRASARTIQKKDTPGLLRCWHSRNTGVRFDVSSPVIQSDCPQPTTACTVPTHTPPVILQQLNRPVLYRTGDLRGKNRPYRVARRYVHYRGKYRHYYSGNWHYYARLHYCLFPSWPSSVTGTTEGNRRYREQPAL